MKLKYYMMAIQGRKMKGKEIVKERKMEGEKGKLFSFIVFGMKDGK